MGLILADTNVVIYFLEGDESLAQIFDDNKIAISFVTELELFSAKKFTEKQLKALNEVVQKFTIYNYDVLIRNTCINLKVKYSLKLPDAIIAATSNVYNLPLLTSDKHFSKISEIETSIYIF